MINNKMLPSLTNITENYMTKFHDKMSHRCHTFTLLEKPNLLKKFTFVSSDGDQFA